MAFSFGGAGKCGKLPETWVDGQSEFTEFANLVLGAAIVGLVCLAISGSHAEPLDNWVRDYTVQVLRGDEQNPGGAGV